MPRIPKTETDSIVNRTNFYLAMINNSIQDHVQEIFKLRQSIQNITEDSSSIRELLAQKFNL